MRKSGARQDLREVGIRAEDNRLFIAVQRFLERVEREREFVEFLLFGLVIRLGQHAHVFGLALGDELCGLRLGV